LSIGPKQMDEHQLFSIQKWQRLQDNRVNDGEHGGIGSNTQRQRRHRDDAECGVLSKAAKRVANVPNDVFQERETPLIAVIILYRFHCTELQDGLTTGLVGRHPGADVLSRLQREVPFNLFSEPGFTAAA
jgi:hypothetical protein